MAIERNFDNLGRIVVPKEMRNKLGFNNCSTAAIELQDDKIIITNPRGMKSKEEIKQEIEFLKESVSNSYVTSTGKPRLVNDDIIEALKWVLSEESYQPIKDKENQ